MDYELKQIGAKVAKIVMAFVVIDGITTLGGAVVPAAVLSLLSMDAVRQGIGELTEASILSIRPKDKGVLKRFTDDIKNNVLEQLKQAKCPKKHVNTVSEHIMSALFTLPMSNLIQSVDKPQIVIDIIKSIFNEIIGVEFIDPEDFINNLFFQINQLIDNNHEYTTIYYLKEVDSKADKLINIAEVNQRHIINIENKMDICLSRMIEWRKRDYASIQEEQKKQVRETYVNEVKSQLDVSFHNLELAQRPGFGAKNAKRSVRKFLTYVDEIDELLINSVIVDMEKCFKCAINVEKKYNFSYDAHRQYADILWSHQRISECIEIEDEIIKNLIRQTGSHSYEVAKANARILGKCSRFGKYKRKTLSYIIACLDCWVDLIDTEITDEQLIELARFFDLIAQFFLTDAEELVYETDDCENGMPSVYKLSVALTNIYQVATELYKDKQLCFDFSEIGFVCVYEMLEKSTSFDYQFSHVIKMTKSRTDVLLQMGVIPLVDIAEFCVFFALALLVGIIVNGQDVPIGCITSIYSTLAMIVGRKRRKELQEQLYQEIAEHIESRENSEEKYYELSIIYHNLGAYFQENNNSAAAEMYFNYSLEEEKKKETEQEVKCQVSLAMAYFTLANFFSVECEDDFNNNHRAIENFKECVAIFERIEKTNSDPETYYRYYVESLIKLAERYRVKWWHEAKETGEFSLDNANRVIEILNKSCSLCAEQYDTEPDIFGICMVNTYIELSIASSFLESILEDSIKTEDFINESLQVCFDMLTRHSEAYYEAFRILFNYLKSVVKQAQTFANPDNSAVMRIHAEAIKVYSDIIDFFKDAGLSDKIDPRMLFPPELRNVPTDFMIATNNRPWLFELAISFETVYNISLYCLCELYSLTGELVSILNLLEEGKKYIESIKNRIGFFMYDQEMRKIEQIREKFIS